MIYKLDDQKEKKDIVLLAASLLKPLKSLISSDNKGNVFIFLVCL